MAERSTSVEQPFLLAGLPPTAGQRRLALAIIGTFAAAFLIAVPYAYFPLPRVDAWLPSFATALFINDGITSVLLFSQFSIVPQRALLVLAINYLFAALMVVPYALTFPGLFAPTGLLGAGLQSAVWLYVIAHTAAPFSFILFEIFRDSSRPAVGSQGSVSATIGFTALATVAAALACVWLVTAQHDLLPKIYGDTVHLTPLANVFAGLIFLLCAVAIALLWKRGSSVLELWMMVTASAWLLEITLQGLFLTPRFSLAWYVGRLYSLIAGSVVLVVLLSEATTLYAHLARSVLRQRGAQQARHVAMDLMAASIAHEVNQPLGAISLNVETALLHLARTPPNHDEIRAALQDIAAASARGEEVIASLRAMFKKGAHGRVAFEVNTLVREVLTMLDIELRSLGIFVTTDLRDGLPPLLADRGQIQQVVLNLVVNAIEAMRPVTSRARRLQLTTDLLEERSEIAVTIADSGPGIDQQHKDRIFEPFFTTKSTGTGIGFAICRSIVASHDGTLRAYPNDPFGTVFQVIMPMASPPSG